MNSLKLSMVGFLVVALAATSTFGGDVETLGAPTESWGPAPINVPNYNNRDPAGSGLTDVDKLDVTITATVDFDEKLDGTPEIIFETGGNATGFSIAYEAPNTVAV